MSSHRLDVSGQRGLSLTMNDPALTAAQTAAKAGDDVRVQLGSFREIRMVLPPNARIERRTYVTRRARLDNNSRPVREDSEFAYDETEAEMLVLVLSGSAALFGRASFVTPPETTGVYESMPHTSVYAKRLGEDLDFTESGTLAAEVEIGELLPWTSPDA